MFSEYYFYLTAIFIIDFVEFAEKNFVVRIITFRVEIIFLMWYFMGVNEGIGL
jgi:hypothetical protein